MTLPPIFGIIIISILGVTSLLLGFLLIRHRRTIVNLRAERAHLRAILDAMPVLVAHLDAQERFTFNNRAYETWFRRSSSEINGMQLRDVIGEAAYAAGEEQICHALAGEMSIFHELSYDDGGERWVQGTLIPEKTAEGKVNGFYALVKDITIEKVTEYELARYRNQLEELVQERTADLLAANHQLQEHMEERAQIEQALRASEEHYRLLADNSQDTIFRFDLLPYPRLSYISPAATRLTGYTPEEHYANPELWLELVHPDDQERILFSDSQLGGSHEPIEVRWRRKDGIYIWYELRYVPIFDESGNCVTMMGISRDITERRQSDEQLRKLSRAVEQSSVSITITDADGYIEYVNPHFTAVTGFTLANVHGQRPRMFAADAPNHDQAVKLLETLQGGGEWRGERYNFTKSGQPYWELGVISPILDTQGNVTHFVAVMEDITQRKQQEREREAILAVSLALRAANDTEAMLAVVLQEIAATFGAAKVFFIARNPTTHEMIVKSVFEEGKLRPNVDVHIAEGKGVAARVYHTSQPYVADDALLDPHFAAPELLGEARAVACVPLIAQGTTIGLFSVARQLPLSSSDVRLLVALADMAATGLQRAAYHEETLRHAANLEHAVAEQTGELRAAYERLQELDILKSKFVSDVSHELRTPVTNISLYLRLIERKPEKQEHYLTVLREESDRLESLVIDILDLVQLDNKPVLALAPIDLNLLLEGVVTNLQASAESRHLELCLQPNDKLPIMMGDTNKLNQVASNLVANAINYTPNGFVRLRTHIQDDDHVSFTVEDSGMGIYAEDMPHLYDRFYRGRRDQFTDVPGTGLGLSIVKELVELHGGSIHIESEVGRGTTFTITLPTTPRVAR